MRAERATGGNKQQRAVGARVGQSSSAGYCEQMSGLRNVHRMQAGSRLQQPWRVRRPLQPIHRPQANNYLTHTAPCCGQAASHQHWIELSRFSIISSSVYLTHLFFPVPSSTHTCAHIIIQSSELMCAYGSGRVCDLRHDTHGSRAYRLRRGRDRANDERRTEQAQHDISSSL